MIPDTELLSQTKLGLPCLAGLFPTSTNTWKGFRKELQERLESLEKLALQGETTAQSIEFIKEKVKRQPDHRL